MKCLCLKEVLMVVCGNKDGYGHLLAYKIKKYDIDNK